MGEEERLGAAGADGLGLGLQETSDCRETSGLGVSFGTLMQKRRLTFDCWEKWRWVQG